MRRAIILNYLIPQSIIDSQCYTRTDVLQVYVEVMDLAIICAILAISKLVQQILSGQLSISGDWAHTVFSDDSLSMEVSQGAKI